MADKMTGEQVQVPCQHCGKDTAVSAFHSLLNMSTVYIAENRDLRAKLAAAEADRNDTTRRAIEAELLCEKLRLEKSEFRDKRDGARARAATAEAQLAAAREREAGLLALVEQQREVMESLVHWAEKMGLWAGSQLAGDHGFSQEAHFLNVYANEGREVLSLTPPAALDDLRRRERSIGAEEELRRIVYELVGSHSWPSSTTITAGELDARADAIAAERDHFADAGKKVNHPAIPESSGGAR